MDQNRLFIAIAVSVAILVGFQWLMPRPHPVVSDLGKPGVSDTATPGAGVTAPPAAATTPAVAAAPPREVPRAKIASAKLEGSISLVGARLDDLVLRDYRETIEPTSPLVRLLEPRSEAKPYFVQFGWTAPEGSHLKVPDDDTLWTASGALVDGKPMTLSWDNGEGLVFEVVLALDDNYMFTVQQRVRNSGGAAAALYPWARIRREYTPETLGYYILHEGMLGVLDGTLKELKYAAAKTDGEKNHGLAESFSGAGGWAGITDKYWLTALIPDQASKQTASFRYIAIPGGGYQVDFLDQDPQTVAPGGVAAQSTRLFAGAKEVHLLDHYEDVDHIPSFDKAVDFGWFYFLTKPFSTRWIG